MASASQVTVELVEQTGVVAIIRLKDPAQVARFRGKELAELVGA